MTGEKIMMLNNLFNLPKNHRCFLSLPIIAMVLVMASGCGFQLREEVELPAVLSRVSVDGESRELVDGLADALRRHGAVVGSAAAVGVGVTVDADFSRVVLTTDSDGRASAYALRYRVVFKVADGDEILLDDETITLNRAYDYDPESAVASGRASASFRGRNAA